jgi:hypothetical protein
MNRHKLEVRIPVYFLHVEDGDQLILDPDGSSLNDLEAARGEAIESARELMAESIVSDGRVGIERSIEVWDAVGVRLLVPSSCLPVGNNLARSPTCGAVCAPRELGRPSLSPRSRSSSAKRKPTER